jgi:hypothetical protein
VKTLNSTKTKVKNMLSRLLTVACTILFANSIAIPSALAYCQVNPNTTDSNLKSLLVGKWYGEGYNAQMGTKHQVYYNFLSTGVFEYQEQACSSITCTPNYAHGVWSGSRQSNSFYVQIKYNDMRRTNACYGWGLRFINSNTYVTGSTTFRRVG